MIGLGIEKLTLLDGAGELYGWGNGSDNEIFGNNSANVIDGQGGSDTVWGAGGNDWLVYSQGEGVDHLDGGADNDTVDFSGFGKGCVSSSVTARWMYGRTGRRTRRYTATGRPSPISTTSRTSSARLA